jgi:hypothetical protein
MGTPSWIPPRPQREWRDLTLHRRQLIQTASAEKNRVGKVLEEATGSWQRAFRRFRVSGPRMREALWEGQADAAQIASFAKARAKKKTPDRIAGGKSTAGRIITAG